jgi:hypothetical protein
MENVIQQINNWFLSKKLFIWTYSISLILLGIVYILIQYVIFNDIKDSLFIGLLFGGSFILLFGIKWIQVFFKEKIVLFYNNLDKNEKLEKNDFGLLTKKIFKNPLALVCGVGYGLGVGYVPFLLNIWDDSLTLQLFLSIFLFIVNFLTGTSLFSLIMLFVFLYKTSNYLSISLYDRNNPASNFVADLSKRASIIASFYIAFSITSIYFSELPINSMTISYSIFAGIVILTAYIVPMIPIRNKIQIQKISILNEISSLLQNELNQLISNAKLEHEINIEKYNSLLELRTKISGIQSIPIGFKAFWNSIYIILITLLPVFIQIILEKIMN